MSSGSSCRASVLTVSKCTGWMPWLSWVLGDFGWEHFSVSPRASYCRRRSSMVEEPARYERRDFNVRILSRFAVGLVIVCVASSVVIWLFEKELNRFFRYPGVASWTSSPKMAPPPPQLQVDPVQELGALRAEEERVLHSYDWVDRRQGVIRIPI